MIPKFNTFIKEGRKLTPKEKFDVPTSILWVGDEDNSTEETDKSEEKNDKSIISINQIQESKCTLKLLQDIFKAYTEEELISQECFHLEGEIQEDDEKLFIVNESSNYKTDKEKEGIVYLITCVIDKIEYLLKIGESEHTWIDRLNSYNTGSEKHRSSGKNSVTNYKVLQSIRKILQKNKEIVFKLYIYPTEEAIQMTWKGITAQPLFCQGIHKVVEYILNQLCIKNKVKPVFSGQMNKPGKINGIKKQANIND